MKHFIRNLEKEYLAVVLFIIGILLVLFPKQFAAAFPYVLGCALILRSIAIVILSLHYKDAEHGPGKAVLYCVMGLTIMLLGSDSTPIIGVIWAVLALTEVTEEINEMWRERHFSAIKCILAAVSVGLAVMLMIDPLQHFVTHVRILGLEIILSCFMRRMDHRKAGSVSE